MLLAILFSLFISSLTFAADKDIVTFQGIVMELDWKKKMAKKIYLLPKYIDEKEKHLYPFIK